VFSWIELALALLKIANSLITWGRERELVSAGQDKQIAEQSAAILVKSDAAKAVMQQMSVLDDKQVDDVLKQLGAP
jgi:hypothetical protein